jgi:hypothetical protein
MVKKIAVYGSYIAKVPVKQRYWIRRKDGIKQRYWKIKHGCFKNMPMKGRYVFYGTGRELYRAMFKALKNVPKGYVDVSAQAFIDDPLKYGWVGWWIDRTVESG